MQRCAQLLAREVLSSRQSLTSTAIQVFLTSVVRALLPSLSTAPSSHGPRRMRSGPSFFARHWLGTSCARPTPARSSLRLELGGASGSLLQRPNHCRGVAVLATVLRKSAAKLSHLGLSHSEIGHTEESEPTAASVASFAVSNGALTSLDVGFNAFGRALWPLLQLLPLVDSLVELDISGNELGDLGVEIVSRPMRWHARRRSCARACEQLTARRVSSPIASSATVRAARCCAAIACSFAR